VQTLSFGGLDAAVLYLASNLLNAASVLLVVKLQLWECSYSLIHHSTRFDQQNAVTPPNFRLFPSEKQNQFSSFSTKKQR
jgi:hypothetical protein